MIGIFGVKLITGYKKLIIRKCDDKEKGNSKWFFTDVYWA
jgi:hypothetical protein